MSISLEELLKLSEEEMLTHNERPTGEQLRNKKQTFFDTFQKAKYQICAFGEKCR